MSANIIDEEQSQALLPSTSENLASIKVFPLIPSLKRDVVVSLLAMCRHQKLLTLLGVCRRTLVRFESRSRTYIEC